MPWVAAIPAVAGLIGGLLGNRGAKKEAQRNRDFQRWLYDPNRINRSAGQLNPFLAYAMGMPGAQQFGPQNMFAQDLRKIAQGQDLSKYLLNQPLHEINRMGDQSMQRFQNMMGRNAASGGMGELYAMSNLGNRNLARARTMRDYGLWREGQRRTDINNLLGQWAGTQGMTMGQNYQFVPQRSSQSVWGGALPFLAQAGADIFSAYRNQPGQTQQQGQGSSIQTGASNPFGGGPTFGMNPNQYTFGR